ncbi:MGMT family protein [bacterium]|nr:MGMT family protein [bacterium]
MTSKKWKPKDGWGAKLRDDKDLPKIVRPTAKGRLHWKRETMLIPRPRDVDSTIRKARKGRLITVGQIREFLARGHGVDITCPLTTGIFLRIAAEAAEEDRAAGKKRITPYWRVVKDDGSLNPKFPGGVRVQTRRLREEGHTISAGKGKKPPRVKDFSGSLVKLA